MVRQRAEKQIPGILHIPILIIQIILFIPIQIVFIPFAIVGIMIGYYKGMKRSRKMGISFTACRALQYRWFMHYFGTRPDRNSIEFIKKFPCESHFGLLATMGPLIISQRLFGFKTALGKVPEMGEEKHVSMVGRRVLMFDEIMKKYVDQMDQIVIMGAGFDLIALNFTKGKKVKVYELDQVNTQKLKVRTLEKAGIEHGWINYVSVDFNRESWVDRLLEAGFDKKKKTLFIWQSVSLFLEEDIVKDALRKMADLSSDGSIVAQDLYSRSYITGENSSTLKRSSKLMEKMGEPWKFGLEFGDDPKEEVSSFLASCGFIMTECHQFGEKLDIDPFYFIVESERI